MEENFLNERRELFQYLVTGSKSVSELLEMAEHLEMDLSSMWYNIVLFHVNSANHEQGEYSNSLVQIEEELRDIYNEHDVLVFDRNLEGKALLFKASSKEQLLQIQYQYIQKIEGVFNQYNHINYYGGTGIPVNRLRELPDSFERASHVFAHRYFVNESQFANGIILDSVEDDNREQFDINNVNMKQIDRTKIYGFLKSGDVKQVSYFLEEFLNELGTNALNSLIFRQYIKIGRAHV